MFLWTGNFSERVYHRVCHLHFACLSPLAARQRPFNFAINFARGARSFVVAACVNAGVHAYAHDPVRRSRVFAVPGSKGAAAWRPRPPRRVHTDSVDVTAHSRNTSTTLAIRLRTFVEYEHTRSAKAGVRAGASSASAHFEQANYQPEARS